MQHRGIDSIIDDVEVFFDEKMQDNLRNIFIGKYYLVTDIDNDKFITLANYFISIEEYVRSKDFDGSLDDFEYLIDNPKIISDFYKKNYFDDLDIEKQQNFHDFFICNCFSRMLVDTNQSLAEEFKYLLITFRLNRISEDLFLILNKYFTLFNLSQEQKIENSRTKLTDELFRFGSEKNFIDLVPKNIDFIDEIRMLYRAKNIDDYIQGLHQRKHDTKIGNDLIFILENDEDQLFSSFAKELESSLKEVENKPKHQVATIRRIVEPMIFTSLNTRNPN
jgi:hypothetical protein